jgi:hypothetical protein
LIELVIGLLILGEPDFLAVDDNGGFTWFIRLVPTPQKINTRAMMTTMA